MQYIRDDFKVAFGKRKKIEIERDSKSYYY